MVGFFALFFLTVFFHMSKCKKKLSNKNKKGPRLQRLFRYCVRRIFAKVCHFELHCHFLDLNWNLNNSVPLHMVEVEVAMKKEFQTLHTAMICVTVSISRRNPLGNWVILIFSVQKPCTRIISIILHFFFLTLFEGYKCNKLYSEITPNKGFLLESTEKTNFKSFKKKKKKMQSNAWWFHPCFLNSGLP